MACYEQTQRERGTLHVNLGDTAVKAKYMTEARDAAERAERSARRAAASAAHPPKTGENGNWWIWDAESGAYTDSGMHSLEADAALFGYTVVLEYGPGTLP